MTTQTLQGKHAVLFGAGGSIGTAVARELASAGAEVFLAGRTPATAVGRTPTRSTHWMHGRSTSTSRRSLSAPAVSTSQSTPPGLALANTATCGPLWTCPRTCSWSRSTRY
jgi:NAD(P)-dependent dehydrogenase (short-subunit alcohol dehydrogenase family)